MLNSPTFCVEEVTYRCSMAEFISPLFLSAWCELAPGLIHMLYNPDWLGLSGRFAVVNCRAEEMFADLCSGTRAPTVLWEGGSRVVSWQVASLCCHFRFHCIPRNKPETIVTAGQGSSPESR